MNVGSNPKRELILKAGKDLFWKFGIRRVTVEEICREADVSKMTFYKYFSNKMELVMSILDGLMEGAFMEYRSIMDSDLSFPEKVSRSILLKQEQTKAMSSEFFKDYVLNAEPEIAKYLAIMSKKTLKMIADDYAQAQKDGNIRKDLRVEFIVYFLDHIMEMIHDEKLVALYDSPQELIMEVTRFFFYGILERDVYR